MKDRDAKGRQARGERQHSSKLTVQKVHDIRRLYSEGRTQVSLASEFGVNQESISFIVNRKHWKHV